MPFNVAPVESADQQPTEVRLYVSANLGGKWDLAQTVSPQTKSFTFRAPGDGEYWFLIRTVDRLGRVIPDVGGRPDMRVIVDTIPPRLELTATRGEAGEIKANWLAVDPLLNADSLKIEYQTASGAWRPVGVDRPRSGGDRTTSKGTLTWWPTDAPATQVQVRAEISDRAGNIATIQAKTEALRPSQGHQDLTTGISQPLGGPMVSSATPPFESTTSPATATAHGKSVGGKKSLASASRNNASAVDDANASTGSVFGPPPIGSSSNDLARAGSSQFPSTVGGNFGTPWPTDHSSDAPLGRNPIPSSATNLQPSPSTDQSPSVAQRNDAFRLPSNDLPSSNSRGFETVNPPIHNQVLAGGAAAPSSASTAGAVNYSALPAGERPRMVSSKSFDMDYEVDSVGPSGIAKVELWGTRDGGRTWTSYGVDNDNRSPIRVNVDGEGLYGFRIAVQSGSGLGGLPPRSGDVPEVWVGVDLTKPMVRLTSTQAGEGPHAGELLIRWEASDAALAARPISLYFSDKPGGPWSIIAAGLENSGQYAWQPDNRVPQRIYLRIEARDEAGNTAIFDAPDAVPLERIQPEGRIRGVRSVTDTATGGRLYEFYR
jgi:hypothetical protein